jgi:uncharacterized protein (TIGR02118 family)
MFQAIVLYGKPQDPAEFDRYYREVHAELVKKVNGLKGFTYVKAGPGPRGEEPTYYMVATLYANSAEEFNAVMSTPEGKAVNRDVRNFATGGVTLLAGEAEVAIPIS